MLSDFRYANRTINLFGPGGPIVRTRFVGKKGGAPNRDVRWANRNRALFFNNLDELYENQSLLIAQGLYPTNVNTLIQTYDFATFVFNTAPTAPVFPPPPTQRYIIFSDADPLGYIGFVGGAFGPGYALAQSYVFHTIQDAREVIRVLRFQGLVGVGGTVEIQAINTSTVLP